MSLQRSKRINKGMRITRLAFINYGKIFDGEKKYNQNSYEILIEIALKKEIANLISAGFTLGNLRSSIVGYNSHILFTNIGIRSQTSKKTWGVGLSLENIGYITKSYTNYKENTPSILRKSLYFKPKYLSAIIGLDIINKLTDKTKMLSAGIKLKYNNKLNFKLGCTSNRSDFFTGNFLSDFISDISFGIGINFNKMNLDIGLMNLGAAGHILSFSINQSINKNYQEYNY